MTAGNDGDESGTEQARRPDPARDRLAAALRENLRRRKEQARSRRAVAPRACDPADTDPQKDR